MTDLTTVEDTIERALPLLGILVRFVPGLAPLAPYLSLIPTLIDAVRQVQAAGSTQPQALNSVAAHLIPGSPNAAALNG